MPQCVHSSEASVCFSLISVSVDFPSPISDMRPNKYSTILLIRFYYYFQPLGSIDCYIQFPYILVVATTSLLLSALMIFISLAFSILQFLFFSLSSITQLLKLRNSSAQVVHHPPPRKRGRVSPLTFPVNSRALTGGLQRLVGVSDPCGWGGGGDVCLLHL